MEETKAKPDYRNWLKVRLASYSVRERVFALLVLGAIAIVAMWKVPDPENIIINIVIVISAFAGKGGDGQRATDKPKEKG